MLDLETYEGLRQARELLKTADAAVFDFKPGELERLGLDEVTLRAANPGLLHIWLPMYTPHGRWSQLPHDDSLLAALNGCTDMQFCYGDVPVHFIAPMVSYHYAYIAATAIAASLYERGNSGEGQALQVSGLDALAASESGGAIEAEGLMRMGGDGARGGTANYRLYECSDGKWLFLGSLTQKFFIQALEAMGLIDVYVSEGIEGEYLNMMMPPGREKVIAALDERFAEQPRDHWMQVLADADVPRAPVGERNEWFRGEVVEANEMRIELEHPELGKILLPGVPAKLHDTPGSVRHLAQEVETADLPAHQPLLPESPESRDGGPLAGVTVVDLGGYIAGTFAPTVLAAMGANVVKVEALDGDPFRFAGLVAAGHNQGKRSLAIDLKNPEGREAIYQMVRGADLVLDNFRSGVLERLGLDYETLKGINPDIICASVTGYGWGPMKERPGFDPLVQAESGMMGAQGGDSEPVFYQLPINDESTAIMAAFGMITALVARQRTGRGQRVETSLANQSVVLQSGELTWYEGRPEAPIGGMNCVGESALLRLYECADGWIALACSSTHQFQQFAAGMGRPEWVSVTTAEQSLAEPRDGELASAIADACKEMARDELLDRLLSREVPVAPVFDISELGQSEWFRQNDFYMETDHPLFGPMRSVAGYGRWSRTKAGFPFRAPMIGEHSFEVLREFGVPEERVATLQSDGAIAQWSPDESA